MQRWCGGPGGQWWHCWHTPEAAQLLQLEQRFNSHKHNAEILSPSLVKAPALPTLCYDCALVWANHNGGKMQLGLQLSRTADTCTGTRWTSVKHRSPTYLCTALLQGKGPSAGEGKQHTHLKGTESA